MRVNGVIADVSGQPLSGYQVVVLHGDVNLKKERPLGTAKTDENGEFSLTVDLARYPLGVNARLAVRRGTRELWSSPIYYNTQADLVIDATIPEAALGISEYERLTEKISPLLQGRDLAGLQPGQITYLAGRSGLAQEQVNQLIAAALLHNAMTGVSAEAAYGLLSQGLPANVSDLAARTAGDWRAALGAAARGNVIASLPRARQAATIAALTARKAAEALHSSSRPASARRPSRPWHSARTARRRRSPPWPRGTTASTTASGEPSSAIATSPRRNARSSGTTRR